MEWFSLYSILFLYLFLFHSLSCCSASPSCRPDQSSTLLHFKHSFSIMKPNPSSDAYDICYDVNEIVPYPKTSTWKNGTNCCLWDGVTCNTFGHVIGLNLNCSFLQGKLLPNNTLFHLTHLQSLDLSVNDFQESHISSNFSQLVSLTHLYLWLSNFSGEVPSPISHLHKLVSLDLHFNSLSLKPNTWERLVNNLTHIKEIYLGHIDMSLIPLSHIFKNLSSSVESLGLRSTRLQGKLEELIPFPPHLQDIYLSSNVNLTGYFPNTNWSNSLRSLDLSNTSLFGELPHNIGQMKFLNELSLFSCQFVGKIPESFWNLTQLTYLDLSNNHFEGHLPASLGNITKLKYLFLSSNNFSGQISSSLLNLQNLTHLYLSHNSLIGTLKLHHLSWKNMYFVDLSSNMLHGELPSSICNATTLDILNLSHNHFTGIIPHCIVSSSLALSVLDLQMNSFSSTIPESFEVGNNLRTLNLNSNMLEGSLPQSLVNCTKLKVLDLGKNGIEDAFPHWLQALEELQVLVLRQNKLHGSIPNLKDKTNHTFPNLRVFDLSSNNFSGPLPAVYFESFDAMRKVDEEIGLQYMGYENYSDSSSNYQDSIEVTWKGFDFYLEKILTVLTIIDLSNNMFEGEIPEVIGELGALKGLNFSNNRLTGAIPSSLGNLRNLEWLDLSSNNFIGKIPPKLTNLNFLSFLNLSQNQLEGCIPRGQQFETFSNDSFQGNKGLRGSQIMIPCVTHEERQPPLPSASFEVGIEFGWKPVLLGYVCGAAFGAAMFRVVIFTRKPQWIASMVNDPPMKRRGRVRNRHS